MRATTQRFAVAPGAHDPLTCKVVVDIFAAAHVACRGIRPSCDDPTVRSGGMWHHRMAQSLQKPLQLNDVNEAWQNVVFAMIGEVLDESGEVCGVRIMDKVMMFFDVWNEQETCRTRAPHVCAPFLATQTRIKMHNTQLDRKSPAFRLEIWVRTTGGNSDNLRSRIMEAAFEPSDGARGDGAGGHRDKHKEHNSPQFEFQFSPFDL